MVTVYSLPAAASDTVAVGVSAGSVSFSAAQLLTLSDESDFAQDATFSSSGAAAVSAVVFSVSVHFGCSAGAASSALVSLALVSLALSAFLESEPAVVRSAFGTFFCTAYVPSAVVTRTLTMSSAVTAYTSLLRIASMVAP